MFISKQLITFVALAALLFATARPAFAQHRNADGGKNTAKVEDETGSYFIPDKNETVIVEATGGRGDTPVEPALRLRFSNNQTDALRKVGNRRYRFLWHGSYGYATFRPDSENPEETEMYLETPQGNYVLKRVRPAATETTSKPAA